MRRLSTRLPSFEQIPGVPTYSQSLPCFPSDILLTWSHAGRAVRKTAHVEMQMWGLRDVGEHKACPVPGAVCRSKTRWRWWILLEPHASCICRSDQTLVIISENNANITIMSALISSPFCTANLSVSSRYRLPRKQGGGGAELVDMPNAGGHRDLRYSTCKPRGSGTLRCNSDIVGNKLPWHKSCMVKLSTRVYINVLAPKVDGAMLAVRPGGQTPIGPLSARL